MIYYPVPKMEIDIPKRDIQSKSHSECIIELSSIYIILLQIVLNIYTSTADCDLSLAKMKSLILNDSIIFIEKQSFPRR